MSLLMQALKKAERSKQDAPPDEDDAALPSEAFDRILALTPDDVVAGRVPPAPDAQAFSLEPIEASEARAAEPAGGVNEQVPALEPAIPAPHDPTPRQSRRHGDAAAQPPRRDGDPARAGAADGNASARHASITPAAAQPPDYPLPLAHARLRELTLQDVPAEIMPEPPFVSEASLADQIAPALGTEPIAPMPDFEAAVAAAPPPGHAAGPALETQEALDAYTSAGTAQYSPHADAPAAGPHGARSDATLDATSGATAIPQSSGASRAQGTAARARAAAHAAARQDQPRRDPARVRLAMLGGALALVAGTLAGVYWYALTSPGPGASLPPVPMPPPGAPAGPAPVAVVAPAAGQPDGPPLPATGLPETTAPGAPAPLHAASEPLQAAGHTGLPSAPATARPHGGSRMPSDDDLQRALQQQSQPPTPAPGEPPAGVRQPAAPLPVLPVNPANAANPANTTNATNAASNPAYTINPAALPGGGPATDIQVARGVAPQRINAALQDGYQAFMAGNYTSAAQHYASALRQDPNNRDALLGNSAIAARRNDVAAATSGYQRLLELNPNDADAQAGLLALRPGDPGQSEMRLKDLLRRDPGAAPLEFALGNLYAQQGRWSDAQQAYFRAYSSVPDNADYAFNLAVGLDRLSQRKLALTYYQRALDLSRTSPAAFDRTAARRRADQLAAPSGVATSVPGGTPAAPAVPAATLPAGPGAAFTPPAPPDSGGNGHQP